MQDQGIAEWMIGFRMKKKPSLMALGREGGNKMTYVLLLSAVLIASTAIISLLPPRVVMTVDSDGRHWAIVGCEFIDYDEEAVWASEE